MFVVRMVEVLLILFNKMSNKLESCDKMAGTVHYCTIEEVQNHLCQHAREMECFNNYSLPPADVK